jgi:hypothetical protein
MGELFREIQTVNELDLGVLCSTWRTAGGQRRTTTRTRDHPAAMASTSTTTPGLMRPETIATMNAGLTSPRTSRRIAAYEAM